MFGAPQHLVRATSLTQFIILVELPLIGPAGPVSDVHKKYLVFFNPQVRKFWKNLKFEERPFVDMHPLEDKYSKEAILAPTKLRKGKTRWIYHLKMLDKINPHVLRGPMLDFGCGIGHFVWGGLCRGIDIWGVDRSAGKIKRYAKLLEYTASPKAWGKRCLIGDGATLPFTSEYFTAVSSWWVFEHIPNPGEVIRELVRITRPKGVIAIRAQDARTCWEGHCKIPWIPYLSGRRARVWIEAFGKSPSLREGVYDISQPQIISILESLGCRIVYQAPPPRGTIDNHWQLSTEEDVRQAARQYKAKFDNGEWKPSPEGLYIYVQKR